MGRDWRVASESQRDHSMASQVAESSPRRLTTVCGVKSARVKKYGDGSKSGSSQAEKALRNASGEPRYTFERLMPGVASSRASLGKKRAMVGRGVTCAAGRKELLPPKSSSLPKPESATFNPAWRAAQETK